MGDEAYHLSDMVDVKAQEVHDAWQERLRARRAELAAQMEQAQQEYAQIEAMLAQLQRNIDAMHGGLQELDALLGHETAQAQ